MKMKCSDQAADFFAGGESERAEPPLGCWPQRLSVLQSWNPTKLQTTRETEYALIGMKQACPSHCSHFAVVIPSLCGQGRCRL